jgi:predicted HTH transcriptional regulator
MKRNRCGGISLVFLKSLQDLKFEDVERLKINEICESQVDYKEQLLEDDKLLKQVCTFANTNGGFLIFGIEETGKGGYPERNRLCTESN